VHPWGRRALPAGEWASPAGPKSNREQVFHNFAENSKISTGPLADPSEKRIIYESHNVASNVGATCGMRNVGDVGDVGGGRGDATSPPFHVYSRTWDWYPGRGRRPEKLGDVKKEDLLPVHFFSQITGIVRDHCTVSKNGEMGVDFDHISVGKKRNFFDLVSCPGFDA
jgi:hypothetical protein